MPAILAGQLCAEPHPPPRPTVDLMQRERGEGREWDGEWEGDWPHPNPGVAQGGGRGRVVMWVRMSRQRVWHQWVRIFSTNA